MPGPWVGRLACRGGLNDSDLAIDSLVQPPSLFLQPLRHLRSAEHVAEGLWVLSWACPQHCMSQVSL